MDEAHNGFRASSEIRSGNPCTACRGMASRKDLTFLSDHAEVVVAPPFVYIPLVKDIIRPDIEVAAQNAWVKAPGAYTGEVP